MTSIIALRDITFTYAIASLPALREVSLDVPPDQICAIIGPASAGKSTLCALCAGFIPSFYQGQLRGSAIVDGQDVVGQPVAELVRHVGLVGSNPFSQISGARFTVYEEVGFGLENLGVPRDEMVERIAWALHVMQLDELRDRSPYELSGGQQQRMVLAATLAMQPPVLVLDEPTAQLDPPATAHLADLLRDLARQGTTILFAEHRLDWAAALAERVVVLDDGSVIADGAPETVLTDPLLLERGIGWPRPALVARRARDAGLWPAALPLPLTFEGLAQGLRETTTDHRPPTTDHRPPTTDQRPTTNDEQPTTDDHRPTTTDQRPTTNDEQPTTNDEQPTTNDQRPTTTDQRPTTNDEQPAASDDERLTANSKLKTQNSKLTLEDEWLTANSKLKTQNSKLTLEDERLIANSKLKTQNSKLTLEDERLTANSKLKTQNSKLMLENVHFTYPGGVEALRGVSLAIGAGERVALLGRNGAGKSTLVRHLNGLLRPSDGRVLVAGMDTRKTTVARCARQVGIVFQDIRNQLFARTVRDEMRFGPRNLGYSASQVEALVDRSLQTLDLTAFAGEHPYDLPLALRRLVAVAAVLALDSAVLVLDEPTAGLDNAGIARLVALAHDLAAQGKSVIVVSHDLDFCFEALDRVILLRQGQVVLDTSWGALDEGTLAAEVGLPLSLHLVRALDLPAGSALAALLESPTGGR